MRLQTLVLTASALLLSFVAATPPEPVAAPDYYNPKGSDADRKTAYAIIHFDDNVWGSAVFHQWSPTSPVIISMLFQNIMTEPGEDVDYAIHMNSVQYDTHKHDASTMCTDDALSTVLTLNGSAIGALSTRHRRMTPPRYSDVVYDSSISLYEGAPNSILHRSFVIRQGGRQDLHRCTTILPTTLDSMRPGAIPCEQVRYQDCLVGARNTWTKCVFTTCVGLRQDWRPLDHTSMMCRQIAQWYPKADVPIEDPTKMVGSVKCTHNSHTLLVPIGPHSAL